MGKACNRTMEGEDVKVMNEGTVNYADFTYYKYKIFFFFDHIETHSGTIHDNFAFMVLLYTHYSLLKILKTIIIYPVTIISHELHFVRFLFLVFFPC